MRIKFAKEILSHKEKDGHSKYYIVFIGNDNFSTDKKYMIREYYDFMGRHQTYIPLGPYDCHRCIYSLNDLEQFIKEVGKFTFLFFKREKDYMDTYGDNSKKS